MANDRFEIDTKLLDRMVIQLTIAEGKKAYIFVHDDSIRAKILEDPVVNEAVSKKMVSVIVNKDMPIEEILMAEKEDFHPISVSSDVSHQA